MFCSIVESCSTVSDNPDGNRWRNGMMRASSVLSGVAEEAGHEVRLELDELFVLCLCYPVGEVW